MFHILIHPFKDGRWQFETYQQPIDGLEPEEMYFGLQFDISLYRIPGERVSEDDFGMSGAIAAKTIQDNTGLQYLRGIDYFSTRH